MTSTLEFWKMENKDVLNESKKPRRLDIMI